MQVFNKKSVHGLKVVVGMSGGVDSAVAALLLKQQGFNVVGVFMKNWEDDDTDEYCTSRQDLIDAVCASEIIGIEIEAVNFSKDYKERVFQYFLDEYQAGRTPNPDILCNTEIKFKSFLDYALSIGGEWIATGHYARVQQDEAGYFQLCKAFDQNKDQTYFLYGLNQRQLSKTLFPLGNLTKKKVREIAYENGLPNHEKKDSTGICFIGERPFRDFLSRYLPKKPGPIESIEGEILGEHEGLMYYTIGQRKGLKIGGRGAAWYVVHKSLERNTLIVVQTHEHPLLLSTSIKTGSFHWIQGKMPRDLNVLLAAKTRYRQKESLCSFTQCSDSGSEINFSSPQWAVTPGQSFVLYQDEVCLGGSIISGSR